MTLCRRCQRLPPSRDTMRSNDVSASGSRWQGNAWDDGQYRDRVIKPAWDKTKEELEAEVEVLDARPRVAFDLFMRAANAAGIPDNPDYSGATQYGVGWSASLQTTSTSVPRC